MKCRQFENRLPDWIAERLPSEQADNMAAHAAVCPACRQSAEGERALRGRWQELPQTPELPSLWPRLAQRLDTAPRRRNAFLPAFAMSSAVAAVCLVSLLARPHTAPSGTTPIIIPDFPASTDDSRIVQLASQVQQLPDGESDAFFAETQQDRRELRRTLQVKEAQ